jgi:hypothetical protein
MLLTEVIYTKQDVFRSQALEKSLLIQGLECPCIQLVLVLE